MLVCIMLKAIFGLYGLWFVHIYYGCFFLFFFQHTAFHQIFHVVSQLNVPIYSRTIEERTSVNWHLEQN